MNHSSFFRCLGLLLFIGGIATGSANAQKTSNFAGNWVFRLGSRTLLVATLAPISGSAGPFTGSLARPQHFSSDNGARFTDIKGPVVDYPIVRSALKGNCLSFTTQNPADKTDEDNFLLCPAGHDHATLKFDVPTFEPWPVTREKGPSVVSTDWESARSYFLDDTEVSNPEMAKIFEIDQKVRQPGIGKIDWGEVVKTDAERREATRKLLAEGKLHTGEDFERAAFVFQHGDKPDDYLLAHSLAMVAVSHNQGSAIWIAAASLDRYLNSIHQPQIFGTQFFFKPNEPTTQEPYNRTLVPDALRRQLNVPSQAAQEEQRKQFEAERNKH